MELYWLVIRLLRSRPPTDTAHRALRADAFAVRALVRLIWVDYNGDRGCPGGVAVGATPCACVDGERHDPGAAAQPRGSGGARSRRQARSITRRAELSSTLRAGESTSGNFSQRGPRSRRGGSLGQFRRGQPPIAAQLWMLREAESARVSCI